MKKIVCDLCHKNIKNYVSEQNTTYVYDMELDLCDNCFDKYLELRNDLSEIYEEKREAALEAIHEEMEELFKKEFDKLKEE